MYIIFSIMKILRTNVLKHKKIFEFISLSLSVAEKKSILFYLTDQIKFSTHLI